MFTVMESDHTLYSIHCCLDGSDVVLMWSLCSLMKYDVIISHNVSTYMVRGIWEILTSRRLPVLTDSNCNLTLTQTLPVEI